MKWWSLVLGGIVLWTGVAAAAGPPSGNLAERGRYLFAVGGCGACHTSKEGPADAGGRAVEIPGGVVYSTNITEDRETGIGTWSDGQIAAAIRFGLTPSGSTLIPAMPYTSYRGLADEDVRALVAYLRTLPPVHHPNRRLRVKIPLLRRILLPLWYRIYFRPGHPPQRAPQEGPARGEYLVRHVGHCGECHTPRGWNGLPKANLYLAGNPQKIEGAPVPNITPDRRTGIGDWSRGDIADFLHTGFKPDGDTAQGLMEWMIEGGFQKLTESDALAIATYLKSIPAIRHSIGTK